MVHRFCIASHAISRSARAPLLKLLKIRLRWPPLPRRATSSSYRPGAFQPPCMCLFPATRRLYFVLYRRLQPVPDNGSGSEPVENQIWSSTPAQACVVERV
eukprot:2491503-Pleurochrysis_carterae.AAC.1